MKIYSFDGKKRIIDNFDDDPSPLYLGQRFKAYDGGEGAEEEINDCEEKEIEK